MRICTEVRKTWISTSAASAPTSGQARSVKPLHEHVVDEELGHRGDGEAGDRRQQAHDDHGQHLGQHRP